MDAEIHTMKRKEYTGPRVMVLTRRNEKGELIIGCLPFTPGMTVERCGRKYQIDAKGQQRRVR